MPKSKIEIINAMTGAILALAGLAAAVGQLSDDTRKAFDNLVSAPPPVIVIVGIVVSAVGVVFLWRGLSRKSRLLRPEVLLIDPDKPEHLKGREDDIRTLCDAVNHPLVFLEGESGAGKSALIRSGLLPALKEDETLLPLYMSTYGGDWESGPETQLVNELWKELSEQQRQQLRLETLDDLRTGLWPEGDSVGVLARIQNELGKTPLLIFDQFDDYQAQHRDRFLTKKGQWLNVKQLTVNKTTRNRFWTGIRDAIQRDAARSLFVTRSDTMGGMISVQFVEPQVYYLGRLDPAFFIALIEELVTPQGEGEKPVILNPQSGWEALKNRLVNDLAHQHRILPIQARTALKGLIKLPYLSVATYDRAGGVTGLEAAYIEDGMTTAAARSGLDRNRVIRALMHLIDQSNPEAPKTQSRVHSRLVDQIEVSDEQLSKMMELLAQNNVGIVRLRVGDETAHDSERQWSLHHDYLARSVIAAQRKAEHWQQLLIEKLRDWKQAVGWRAAWQSLLSPWQLLHVLFARLRGHVRLGGYRAYLGWSTVGLLPYLAVLLLLLIGWDQGLDYQARKDVEPILATIRGADLSTTPRGEEVLQLWRLSAGRQRLKDAFVRKCLTDSSSHSALLKRRSFVSQAIIGLDPNVDQRKRVLKELLSRRKDGPLNSDSREHFFPWITDICSSSPSDFENESTIVAAELVAAIQKTTDDDQLSSLDSALGSLADRLPATQAAEVAKAIAAAIQETADDDQRISLGGALGSLSENLPTTRAAGVAKEIVAAMQNTNDPEQLRDLSSVLGSLGEKLPATQAVEGAKKIVAVMQNTTTPYQSNTLAKALGSLVAPFRTVHAEDVAQAIMASMQTTNDADQLSAWASALASLGEKLPATQATEGARKIVAAMQDAKSNSQLGTLANALGSLGRKLPAKQAADGAKKIVAAMKNTSDAYDLDTLASALGSLGDELPATHAEEAANVVLPAIQKTRDPEDLNALAHALGSLGGKLPATQAADGAERIVAIMQNNLDSHDLRDLVDVLGTFGDKVPATQAADGAKAVMDAIQDETNVPELGRMFDALGSLVNTFRATHAEVVAEVILANIRNTRDAHSLQKLAKALGVLGEKLSTSHAEEAANVVLAAMQDTKDLYQLYRLGVALGSLGEKLPAMQAAAGAKKIVAAMQISNDANEQSVLGTALESLGDKLPATQAAELANELAVALIQSTDCDSCESLARGLAALQTVPTVDPTVVEWLKGPLAVGDARVWVLRFLGQIDEVKRTAAQEFKDLQSFTDWAKKYRPDLDLHSPPENPFRQSGLRTDRASRRTACHRPARRASAGSRGTSLACAAG